VCLAAHPSNPEFAMDSSGSPWHRPLSRHCRSVQFSGRHQGDFSSPDNGSQVGYPRAGTRTAGSNCCLGMSFSPSAKIHRQRRSCPRGPSYLREDNRTDWCRAAIPNSNLQGEMPMPEANVSAPDDLGRDSTAATLSPTADRDLDVNAAAVRRIGQELGRLLGRHLARAGFPPGEPQASPSGSLAPCRETVS
jgi:hypothetical protein